MTPAINIVKKAKIVYKVHEYTHDVSTTAYGLEAACKMGVPQAQVFKTLVVSLDHKELVDGVVPVSSMLQMKSIAKAAGAKNALMANTEDVERSTGYVLGGVSPLGQKKRLRTFIDVSAKTYETVFVSAGRRGLEIELSPTDLVVLTHGKFADIAQSN